MCAMPPTDPPIDTAAGPAGTTLAEVMVVLVMLAITAALAVAIGARLLDSVAVETATAETTALFARARDHAVAQSTRTAVRIDAAARRVIVHVAAETVAVADFSGTNVQLQSTRDSMAYAPSGLGYGAANLRVVLTRSAATDTITVSRLGRVAR